MALKLKYQDRYRLWNDLIRASTDRLFIPTTDRPHLHMSEAVEIEVPDLSMPIVVRATVIGRRGSSNRFPEGVYVRIPQKEVEKCRRFLSLERLPGEYESARRARRVHCELKVRFRRPEVPGHFTTKNLSEVGTLVTCPKGVVAGQRVALTIEGATTLELYADVAWVPPAGEMAGLSFVELTPQTKAQLREVVQQQLEEHLRHRGGDPLPVVVADDEPDILTFISTALSRHGYKVYQAHSGDEALRLIQHLHPTLVVMDILMPGIDGADVCKVMRSDAELVDIPVIFVSALEAATLHAVADESGATDYLTKPLHLSDLLNLLGAYLKR